MIDRLKTILLILGLLVPISLPAISYADELRGEDKNPLSAACNAINSDDKRPQVGEAAACAEKGSKNPISGGTDSILYKISLVISSIAGAVAILMIIVAGINMITSTGDSQKNANNRNMIIFAIVGLIIIALAQALIVFVINSLDL